MKFTTPCFVRVENAIALRKLDIWLESIGYEWKTDPNSEIREGKNWVLDVDYVKNSLTVVCSTRKRMWTVCCSRKKAIDCGTNVKLFKGLAAMNDENDREQWFTDGIHFEKSNRDVAGIESWKACYRTTPRKATAEEIIEHFKNR